MREHLRDRKPVGSRLPASVLIGQFAHEPAQDLRRRGKHLDARQGHVSSYNGDSDGSDDGGQGGEFDINADTTHPCPPRSGSDH
jgi:hypothetical protein